MTNINVPFGSAIEKESSKLIGLLHNSELRKRKNEIPNEACFLKVEACCYRLQCNSVDTTVKEEEETMSKRITEYTINKQTTIGKYKSAIYWGRSKYVTNCTINSNQHHLKTREQNRVNKIVMVNLSSIITKLVIELIFFNFNWIIFFWYQLIFIL